MTEDRKLSAEWGDLAEAGKVPDKGKGKTVERAEQAKTRQRKRYPSEDRRNKITATLPADMIEDLRAICEAEGYPKGQVVSAIVEDLLRVGVDAYKQGRLETREVVTKVHRLVRRSE